MLDLPHVAVVRRPGAQARGRNSPPGRSGAGARADRGALGSHPGAADDPDRNRRAALREPPGDKQAASSARTCRPRGAGPGRSCDRLGPRRPNRRVAPAAGTRWGGDELLEGDVAAVADRIVAIMDESVPDRHGGGRMSGRPGGCGGAPARRAARDDVRADRGGAELAAAEGRATWSSPPSERNRAPSPSAAARGGRVRGHRRRDGEAETEPHASPRGGGTARSPSSRQARRPRRSSVDSIGYAPARAASGGLGFAPNVLSVEWDGEGVQTGRSVLTEVGSSPSWSATRPTVVPDAVRAAPTRRSQPPRRRSVPRQTTSRRSPRTSATARPRRRSRHHRQRFLLSIGRGIGDQESVEPFEELADSSAPRSARRARSSTRAEFPSSPAGRPVGPHGQAQASISPSESRAPSSASRASATPETVIAVNTDPDAPIFGVATYGRRGSVRSRRGAQSRPEHRGAIAAAHDRELKFRAWRSPREDSRGASGTAGLGGGPLVRAGGVLDSRVRLRRRRADRQVQAGASGSLPPRRELPGTLAVRHADAASAPSIGRRDPYVGWAHRGIFYGFVVLFIGTVILAHQQRRHRAPVRLALLRGHFYLGYSLVLDVLGIALLVGLLDDDGAPALIRPSSSTTRGPTARRRSPAGSARYRIGDWVFVGALLYLVVTGYLLEGVRIAMDRPGYDGSYSPVGWLSAQPLSGRFGDGAGPRSPRHLVVPWAARDRVRRLDPVHEGRPHAHRASPGWSCAIRSRASACRHARRSGQPSPPGTRRFRLLDPAPARPGRVHALRQVPRGLSRERERLAALASRRRSWSCASRRTARWPASASAASLDAAARLAGTAATRRCRRPMASANDTVVVLHAVQRLRRGLPGRDRAGADHQPDAPPPRRRGRGGADAAEDARDDPRSRATRSASAPASADAGPRSSTSRSRTRARSRSTCSGSSATMRPSIRARSEVTRALARLLNAAGVDFGILYDGERNAGNDVRRVGEEGLFESLAEEQHRGAGRLRRSAGS